MFFAENCNEHWFLENLTNVPFVLGKIPNERDTMTSFSIILNLILGII